jgi:hypothetical protein
LKRDFARSLEKRCQLEDAGRTTITGCNGRVHGWRVVEDGREVKVRAYRPLREGKEKPGLLTRAFVFEEKLF